jgi:hypothetical protein
MSGAIAMGTSKITGMGDPTSNQDAATKVYTDTQRDTRLALSGGTMSGAIAMGTNKITGAGDPTSAQDVATKNYIDTLFGSTSSAASSASAAATSATASANSATASASSATASANSATAAAASYDDFDDRYLGAKSSAPTVDNDGDALVVGALFFDTSSNSMKVYSSGGWVAAGSSVNGTSQRFDYVVGTNSGSYTDSSTTTFPCTYDAGFVDVYLNGVKLVVGTDVTATSGTTVVLASAAATGDNISIVGYGTFNLANWSISESNDVDLTGNANNAILAFDSTDSRFEPTLTPTLTSLTTTGNVSVGGNLDVTGSFDMSDANITNIGSIALDTITDDGGTITLDSSGDIHLDADSEVIRIRHDGGDIGMFQMTSNDLILRSMVSDKDIVFKGNDNGSTISALTLDMSEAGAATFSGDVLAPGLYVGSANPSYDFYNNGTSYFNGAVTVDNNITVTGDSLEFGSSAFKINATSSQTGQIGFNRNPADGAHLGQSGLNRYQINGPFSGSDFLDFQNYNSSGSYLGGFRVEDGAIRAEPKGISEPSYSFDNDTDTGMTRPTADTIQLVTGGAVRLRVNSDGLKFGSDTAAANSLNDYEQGTWTPVFSGTTGAGSGISYGLRAGRYTKIGNMVNAMCDLYVSGMTAIPSGQVKIEGLPFGASTSDGMSGNWYALGEPNLEGLATSLNSDSVQALLNGGQSYFVLYRNNKATTGMSAVNWTTHFDTSGRIRFSFQYMTDA